MSTWRFYIETFGCKVNQHESQLIRESWNKQGGEEIFFAEGADIICINSCAITSRAERDARNAIYRLKKLAPTGKIIFTGCAAQLYGESGASKRTILPDISIVPQKQKAELLFDPWQVGKQATTSTEAQIIHGFQRSRPVVKVQDGCAQNCAFCIVPKTRGRPVSRPFKEIFYECKGLLQAGFPEIVISGINLRQYICPDTKCNFWSMLKNLEFRLAPEFCGQARLRMSSLEPSMLDDQALEILADSRMLAPHLHISLQHASPQILERMGRKDTKPEKITDFINMLSRLWPVAGIGADILVGFPGEGLDDLKMLAAYVKELPFSYAHVFPFSPRPGTAAAKFPEQLDQVEKSSRAAKIRKIIKEKQENFLAGQMGIERFSVVLDQPDSGDTVLKGRNEYYAPCFMDKGNYARKIIAVRPKGRMNNGLLVEAIENENPGS